MSAPAKSKAPHNHMADLVDGMAILLMTSEFADLTFRCNDGTELKAHRNVVCRRSPVLAAACSGGFKEAATGVINVGEFDTGTVCRMLAFLYTGDYEDGEISGTNAGAAIVCATAHEVSHYHLRDCPPVEGSRPPSRATSQLAPSITEGMSEVGSSASNPWIIDSDSDTDTDTESESHQNDDSRSRCVKAKVSPTDAGDADKGEDAIEAQESDPIVANMYAYAIADYYDIPSLKAHAIDKLQARVSQMGGWPVDRLTVALDLVARLTREGVTLNSLIGAAAAENALALLQHPAFRQLLRAGGEAIERFTAAMAAQQAAQRQQLDETQRRHDVETAALREQLEVVRSRLAEELALRRAAESELRFRLATAHACRNCLAGIQPPGGFLMMQNGVVTTHVHGHPLPHINNSWVYGAPPFMG